MKLIFEPKPYKTFAFQVNFNVGWRHEMVKERGTVRESLENLAKLCSEFIPSWFKVEHSVEAEYSYLRIFGTIGDTDILRLLKLIDADFPEHLSRMGAGIEVIALSGSFKSYKVDEILSFDPIHKPGRTRLSSKPRNFISARNLNRLEKHFLTFSIASRGGELYLEISKNGDRLHYGKFLGNLNVRSMNDEIKRYELDLLRRRESTIETVAFLSTMNIFENSIRTYDDILRDIEKIRIHEIAETLNVLRSISERLKR